VLVFVQIPCLDEEATLPLVLAGIPRQIPGVDAVEVLVVDDGSSDRTAEVARAHGVTHVLRHTRTMGLARSFRDGVDYALRHGADVVVNTDGDNQYPQERIGDLVRPILEGTADIVVGDRQTRTIAHFSPFKRLMQRVGSRVVSIAADTPLPDAASGFRAYSRAALLRLNVVTEFSYCMETIIQAGHKRLRITSVPVTTNPKTRESRLFRNIWHHMFKSASAIVRSYLMYKPRFVFATLAVVCGVLGMLPFVRFLARWVTGGDTAGNIQSLVFGTVLLVGALLSVALGVISDLLRTNRVLLEEQLERIKELQYGPARDAGGQRVVAGERTDDAARAAGDGSRAAGEARAAAPVDERR
jgi:glycosyltransferase involved in cell wall biosynthesis